MSNPAFIVDGFSEKLVIGQICPGKPVRRTDLNGKSVSIQAIANKVGSLVRLYNNRYYPIIVIIDRENRIESSPEIAENLKRELDNQGLGNIDIRINVADRMFENWIVADWESLPTKLEKPEITESVNGCSILKKALDSYHKTTDGVELFTKANPSNIYQNSESFRTFIDSLNDVNCNYKEFAK